MQVLEQNLWKKNNHLQPSHIILCAFDCAFQSKLIALIRIYCKQLTLNKPYLYTHTDALCICIHNLHTNIYLFTFTYIKNMRILSLVFLA